MTIRSAIDVGWVERSETHDNAQQPGAWVSLRSSHPTVLLTFDTTRPDPEVPYQTLSIDNELIHTFSLTKSQISHR